MRLPLHKAVKQIEFAKEEETREYAFRIYLASYPNMDKKNFITFNEFYENLRPRKVVMDTRSQEEIMEEIIEIEMSFRKDG